MSRIYTVTQMNQDEANAQMKETIKIANEYLVAGQLNPDEEIKKLVLSTGDQTVVDRITSAYKTAESITPSVAKAVLPGVVANVKILQTANEIFSNYTEQLENEVGIVTEQRDALQLKLNKHENSEDTSRMLDMIRQEREKQLRLQPKKSQSDIVRKQLARALKRQIQ